MDSKGKWGGPIAVAAVLLVMAAAYVAAYFLLSTPVSMISNESGSLNVEHLTRYYDHWSLRTIFTPASQLEAWLKGMDVTSASLDDGPLMAHPSGDPVTPTVQP